MTNNYRRLHGMPMKHHKAYPHEHRVLFGTHSGKTVKMSASAFLDALDAVFSDYREHMAYQEAKEMQCQKSTS